MGNALQSRHLPGRGLTVFKHDRAIYAAKITLRNRLALLIGTDVRRHPQHRSRMASPALYYVASIFEGRVGEVSSGSWPCQNGGAGRTHRTPFFFGRHVASYGKPARKPRRR
jgi:hypothetical protein